MKKSKLKLILEMDLDMVEIMDEYAPICKEVDIKIVGPRENKKAADKMNEHLGIMLPYLIGEMLMRSSTDKTAPAIATACKMVLAYIDDSTEGV